MKRIVTLAIICTILCIPQSGHTDDTSPKELLSTLQRGRLVYVDDTVIHVLEFADYLYGSGTRPSNRRERDLDSLGKALQAYIDQFCLILDSDSVAILSDIESRRRARWRMSSVAGPVITKRVVVPQVSVDRATVEKFYNDSLELVFTAPAQREVRHILIAPRTERKDGVRIKRRENMAGAKVTADSLLEVLRAGASFEAIAVAFSDDSASQQNSGYLGWLFPGNTTTAFDTAVFAAELGEVRGPVKTMHGYHLIKVEAERPESIVVLDDRLAIAIKGQLEMAQARKIGTEWADSIMKFTQWNYNDDVLTDLTGLPDETWVLNINERDTLWFGTWNGAWEYFKRTQNIVGLGTLDEKHTSLRKTGFVYTYMQAAEDLGFADDAAIVAERIQHIQSETIRLAHRELRDLQQVPDDALERLNIEPEKEDIPKPLRVQMIRNSDTAAIWSAYRSLEAGNEMSLVVRWFHDNIREARSGLWNLGWVGKEDLDDGLWGKIWILGTGKHTRPIKHKETYYIFRLQDRKILGHSLTDKHTRIDSTRSEYRSRGLAEWRNKIRATHSIRINQALWKRLKQLWRR